RDVEISGKRRYKSGDPAVLIQAVGKPAVTRSAAKVAREINKRPARRKPASKSCRNRASKRAVAKVSGDCVAIPCGAGRGEGGISRLRPKTGGNRNSANSGRWICRA